MMLISKIGLIGSTGRVGQMVTNNWRHSRRPWANAPVQSRYMQEPASAKHIPWDITEQGKTGLLNWMQTFGQLDCLVVLAGTTPATGQNMQDNLTLTKRYIEAFAELGLKRVLFASSSAVYGAGDGTPLNEDSNCVPLNEYGKSKLQMEKYLSEKRSDCIEICCLRIGNVVGADALLSNADQKKITSIDIFNNGRGPLRSYIGPRDLADVLGQLATTESALPFTLNVAASEPIYMDDLAGAAQLEWRPRPAPPTAIQNITLNCDKLETLVHLPEASSKPIRMTSDWKRHRKP